MNIIKIYKKEFALAKLIVKALNMKTDSILSFLWLNEVGLTKDDICWNLIDCYYVHEPNVVYTKDGRYRVEKKSLERGTYTYNIFDTVRKEYIDYYTWRLFHPHSYSFPLMFCHCAKSNAELQEIVD